MTPYTRTTDWNEVGRKVIAESILTRDVFPIQTIDSSILTTMTLPHDFEKPIFPHSRKTDDRRVLVFQAANTEVALRFEGSGEGLWPHRRRHAAAGRRRQGVTGRRRRHKGNLKTLRTVSSSARLTKQRSIDEDHLGRCVCTHLATLAFAHTPHRLKESAYNHIMISSSWGGGRGEGGGGGVKKTWWRSFFLHAGYRYKSSIFAGMPEPPIF